MARWAITVSFTMTKTEMHSPPASTATAPTVTGWPRVLAASLQMHLLFGTATLVDRKRLKKEYVRPEHKEPGIWAPGWQHSLARPRILPA